MFTEKPFTVRAPGRVFLFGEHSDYLSLEVISGALNYSIEITVTPRVDCQFSIQYSDLSGQDFFHREQEVTYRHKRDYLRSAFNVLKKKGIKPKNGANIEIKGTIPIAAGLSSSSALSVACIMTFAKLANKELTREQIAQYGFEAEVVEFGESGGMMDHMASVNGGIIHVDFGEKTILTRLPSNLKGLVIGDSQEKKEDTVGDIKMIRSTVESGYSQLGSYIENFSHRETPLVEIMKHIDKIAEPCKTMTIATIRNRDLTKKALAYIQDDNIVPEEFGDMIDQHHVILRDGLKRSTPKLEKMIAAVKKAGALGAKMNGSGGGGTMLVYAPGNEKEMIKAIEEAGGKAYPIKISPGATITATDSTN